MKIRISLSKPYICGSLKMEPEPRSCISNDARLPQTTNPCAQSAEFVSVRDNRGIGMD